jgi:hypothetical protein
MSNQADFSFKFGSTLIAKYLYHVSQYSPLHSQHEQKHSQVGQDCLSSGSLIARYF